MPTSRENIGNSGIDDGIVDTGWEDMSEGVDIEKRLEDGEDPEEILKEAQDNGTLSVDFIEENAGTLLQYGLNEDKIDEYDKMARVGKEEETLEDKRRRDDEEPEQSGYETGAA